MEGVTRLKQGRDCTKFWSLAAVLYRIYIFMFFRCTSTLARRYLTSIWFL